MCPRRKEPDGLLQALGKIERTALHIEPIRILLAQIENVIDHRLQQLTALRDEVNPLANQSAELVGIRDVDDSDDAI